MKSTWIDKNYNQQNDTLLYVRKGHESIAYSDGDDVEQQIFRYVNSARDKSVASDELFQRCTTWATTYHLSAARSNLLRPFEVHFKGKSVLELGCGCGAITRFFGECGADVTAVEGSLQRASIAARRCDDLSNVKVLCDSILELPQAGQLYDVVTLIGVLEYARMFGSGDDPIQDTLRLAHSFLKPGGCLVLAIENRFGLKYFAGADEDHLARAMAGIQGEYTSTSPVTFSRKELEERLLDAAFVGLDLHLPYPDYKLPSLMLHGAALDAENFEVGPLLQESVVRDVFSSQYSLFSMQAVYEGICKAGLTADLANSFLYFAWKDEATAVVAEGDFARYYGARNPAKFAKEILFKKKHDDICVLRKRLYGENAVEGPFEHVLANEPYIPEPTVQGRIIKAVNRYDWNVADFANAVQPWYRALRRASVRNRQGDRVVSGRYFDFIPANAVIVDGRVQAIDQEWQIAENVELSFEFMVFRGLYYSLTRLDSVACPKLGTPERFADLCFEVMKFLDVPFSKERIERDWKHDDQLFAQIFGDASATTLENLNTCKLEIRFTYRQLEYHAKSLEKTNRGLLQKFAALEEENAKLKETSERLQNVVEKMAQKFA